MSVTLPPDHYREMQQVAAKKKVSMAWVIRDAVDRYLAEQNAPISGPEAGCASGRDTPKRGVA